MLLRRSRTKKARDEIFLVEQSWRLPVARVNRKRWATHNDKRCAAQCVAPLCVVDLPNPHLL